MSDNKADLVKYGAGAKRLSIFSPNLVHPAPTENAPENASTLEKVVRLSQAIPEVYIDNTSSNASIGSLGSRAPVTHSEKTEHVETTKMQKVVTLWHHILTFWRNFSVICFSPIFVRHRNFLIVIVEVLVPGLIALIIFTAFTSGISWKQVNTYEAAKIAYDFPEITPELLTSKFRDKHADPSGRILMFFTPANPLTVNIMKGALANLMLDGYNRVDKNEHNMDGVLGVKSVVELVERALLHRKEKMGHGLPIGVSFSYDETDVDPELDLPYNLTYTIYSFDESIHLTADYYPFVSPPPESKYWLSPYVSSGFLGLQYAIDNSFMRIVTNKQEHDSGADLADQRTLKLDSDSKFTKEVLNFLGNDIARPGPSRKKGIPGARTAKVGKGNVKVFRKSEPLVHLSDLPDIKLKMFNFANFRSEDFRHLVSFAVTFSLVVAYSFMAFFIVRQIVEENTSGIKDLLQMHGLPHYIHWVILFFHALLFRSISTFLVVVSLQSDYGHGAICEGSSTSVLFVFIYIHQLCLTFMNFFIATCVKSKQMCGVIAIFCGVLSFYIPETFDGMKLVGIYTNYGLAVIFPNWALRHVIRTIIDLESDQKGAEWTKNFWDRNRTTNLYSVGGGMLLLTVTGILYFFMAAYHDMTGSSKLFPPSRNWYDFKELARQRRESKEHQEELHRDIAEGRATNFEKPAIYEEPEPDKKCFVHIRNLSKRYGKHKVALDLVSMNILHEEVTCILGHTDSGKSTLMAILAGMMMPSSGYAIVKGYDVNFESDEARKYVGLCTQKLVAFNLLTVREHINLCYRLRGYSKKDCDRHCATLLQRLKLWSARSSFPERLKIDEMRRLGIALALTDAPKVLLLDEPTAGMDPTERREVWDILYSLKNHHTIIITTNFLDEAEFLADRVALLAHGRLICFGSLDYLKQSYDTGYFLKIEPIPTVIRMDSNAVLKIIRNHLGADAPLHIKRHSRVKDVDLLEVELPANQKEYFARLCEDLEEQKNGLSIARYSIRQVSLSDIFVRICSSVAAQGTAVDLYVRRDSVGDIRSAIRSEIPEPPEKTAISRSKRYQIYTLVKKRWSVIKTSYQSLLLYFFVPLLMVWIVVFQAKLFILPPHNNPTRTLTARAFDRPGSIDDLRMFYKMGQGDPRPGLKSLMKNLTHPYGFELPQGEVMNTRLFETLKTTRGMVGYNKEKHMAAFEFQNQEGKKSKKVDFIGYFSSGALHSGPIVLNLMNNLYLRAVTSHHERPFTITTINDPLPEVKPPKFGAECGIICTVLALLMSFAFAFLSHSCIFLPMLERQNGMKHLQLMCGVHPALYWFAMYIVDAVIMIIMICIIVIIFAADHYKTFSSAELIGVVWVICLFYLPWSGLMYAYFFSTIIPLKFNGYNVLAGLHVLLGILPFVFLSDTDGALTYLRNFMLFFVPPFTITSVFRNYFDVAAQRDICGGVNDYIKSVCDVNARSAHTHYAHRGHYASERLEFSQVAVQDVELAKCCKRICLPAKSCYKPPAAFNSSRESWNKPGLITDSLALFFQGFVYLGLLILVERGVVQRCIQRIFSRFLEYREQGYAMARKSGDVYQESLAVHSKVTGGKYDVVNHENVELLCLELTKSTSTKMIVRDFNLEVKSGQCIAILGGGGSGKTSIVKMIAGEMTPTRGNCYIRSKNLFHNRKDYLGSIGYCPQKTGFYAEFTGAQMCKLMGRLRGIPDNLLDTHSVKWLNVFGLEEVAHDKCKYYADGMKQRLGAVMAIIGSPNIILLDEPTTAVDPYARERFWAVIEQLNREGHTIILTTFSTDEAFRLASKVIVLVEGSTQCVGSPEYLQTKYGRGHTILIKLKHNIIPDGEIAEMTLSTIAEFKQRLQEAFNHLDLLDEHDNLVMYFLRDARFTWADVFRMVNSLATEYNIVIDSFDVAESEIEDIFIFMTNKYHELNKPRRSDPTPLVEPKPVGEGDEDLSRKSLPRSSVVRNSLPT